MASTDRLTGAANRHVFDSIFDQILRSARRRGKEVALICIDIDHFKEVNDTFGHQAGDLVIRRAVKKRSVNFGREDIRVTLSCGVTQYRSGEELYSLIARVDAALYRAKNEGRDRVIVAV